VNRCIWDRWCQYAVFPADGRFVRSNGTNRLLVPPVKRSAVGSRAFPVVDPKTWSALPEDVTSSQSFAASSKGGFSGSLFRTSSSDTDCILTFTLGLSVPTLRRFCRFKDNDMI